MSRFRVAFPPPPEYNKDGLAARGAAGAGKKIKIKKRKDKGLAVGIVSRAGRRAVKVFLRQENNRIKRAASGV